MTFDEFKKRLFQEKDKKAVFETLKYNCSSFDELRKIENRILKELPGFAPLFKRLLFGNSPTPKSYSELDNEERPRNWNADLHREIWWQALALNRYSGLINEFNGLQQEFQHNLLLGNYTQSRLILDRIEAEICISYWSIENRFILDENEFGSEKNWETRNLILDKNNNLWVRVLGNKYSYKAERPVSFYQYNEETISWERSSSIDETDYSQLLEYFRFKGNYFLHSNYTALGEILSLESKASIIDRFILFKRIAQYVVVQNLKESSEVIRMVQFLAENIEDIEFMQLLLIKDMYLIKHDENQRNILQAIDEYTQGNYLVSASRFKDLILSCNGNNIDLIELYVKSLIESFRPFEDITEHPSIVNAIANCFYDLLVKGANTDNAIIKILKLSTVFNNSPIGLKLYSFVKLDLAWESEIDHGFLSRISSRFYNPKLWENIYDFPDQSKRFIESFSKAFPSSATVSLFKNFYMGYKGDEEQADVILPVHKRKLYHVRKYFFKKDFDSIIPVLEEQLMDESVVSPIIEFEYVSDLYLAYLAKSDLRSAMVKYTNAYLKNVFLVKRCNTAIVLQTIIKEKFRTITNKSSLIELPIFFKINSSELNRIKQAYEQFLMANEFTKPSELINKKNFFEKNKLVFFLRNVCVPEVMQLSKYLTSSIVVNEERIIICQFLAEFDTANAEAYNAEIAATTQRNIINKVIGNFDERKIYVNEDKIKSYLIKSENISANPKEQSTPLNRQIFERYTKLVEFVNDNKEFKEASLMIHVEEDGETIVTKVSEDDDLSREDFDVVVSRPVVQIFDVFFSSIRDLFLFNDEYGLDAYLSSKIRHGTLPNHLRSVFENYRLVTSQADGIYSINEYWMESLELDEEKKKSVQSHLSNFSKKVDEISRNLKEELIQCKTIKRNSKPSALFNFAYENNELIVLFVKQFASIKNYDQFIEKAFSELWNRTESCLLDIRNKINGDLKGDFNNIISELEDDLLHSVQRSEIQELLHSINTCRTEIQTKLGNISNWFRRSESSFDGKYALQTLVDTSIQIIKNINPSFRFSINKGSVLDLQIKGEFHQHFIELVTNFLQNMIDHPKVDVETLEANVNFEEKNGMLYTVFENCISDKVDAQELEKKLRTIKNNWTKTDGNVSLEKNSGYPKIKKILRSDLGLLESHFDFDLKEKKLFITLAFETRGLLYENINY